MFVIGVVNVVNVKPFAHSKRRGPFGRIHVINGMERSRTHRSINKSDHRNREKCSRCTHTMCLSVLRIRALAAQDANAVPFSLPLHRQPGQSRPFA